MQKAILFAITAALALTTYFYGFDNSKSLAAPRLIKSTSVSDSVEAAWTAWKMHHGKTYGTDTQESYRKSVFAANMNKVSQKNARGSKAKFGLNKFADLTASEFKAQYLGTQAPRKVFRNEKKLNTSVPSSKDWTGVATTPVKDQGQCGSCWAFSTTGSSEGAYYIKHGSIISLSEQQLVDCAGSTGNMGCNGGLMDNAFRYMETKGLMAESDYAYTATDGYCRYSASSVAFNLDSLNPYTDVAEDDNDQLVAAIAQQPVSVAIEAEELQLYTGGIYDDWSCDTNLDHGVLAVGYGSENGQLFYKVKNSWGADWGEEGYFRFARREGQSVGMCGITKSASYPTAA